MINESYVNLFSENELVKFLDNSHPLEEEEEEEEEGEEEGAGDNTMKPTREDKAIHRHLKKFEVI